MAIENEGKDFEWCEEQGETILQSADGEDEAVVTHVCRYGPEHDGPHRCFTCSTAWEGTETPC